LETRPKPKIVTIDELLTQVVEYKSWLDLGGRNGGIGDRPKNTMSNVKVSYMIYHIRRYVIDVSMFNY
jgi:hypothetical protein